VIVGEKMKRTLKVGRKGATALTLVIAATLLGSAGIISFIMSSTDTITVTQERDWYVKKGYDTVENCNGATPEPIPATFTGTMTLNNGEEKLIFFYIGGTGLTGLTFTPEITVSDVGVTYELWNWLDDTEITQVTVSDEYAGFCVHVIADEWCTSDDYTVTVDVGLPA